MSLNKCIAMRGVLLLAGFSSACRLIQSRSSHAVAQQAGDMVVQVRMSTALSAAIHSPNLCCANSSVPCGPRVFLSLLHKFVCSILWLPALWLCAACIQLRSYHAHLHSAAVGAAVQICFAL
jgi:hypothetical protein